MRVKDKKKSSRSIEWMCRSSKVVYRSNIGINWKLKKTNPWIVNASIRL